MPKRTPIPKILDADAALLRAAITFVRVMDKGESQRRSRRALRRAAINFGEWCCAMREVVK